MNKLLFWVLAAAAVVLFFADVYAVNYAPPGSAWKKNSMVMVIGFIAVTQFALRAYRRAHPARS